MVIRMLDDPAEPDLGEVGGKSLNLIRLTAAGFPVPAGFCVTTEAYREAVGERLEPVLAALGECEAGETAKLAGLAGQARRIVAEAPVPESIATAITAAYAELGSQQPSADEPVAVRSSATAEDLPDASFAGQQDTYLNVVGAAAVVAAVRDCWASLWTDRAVSYRASNGIDPAGVALAVVVQELVDATAAGVMFTANPVTGTRHQIVIDASPGLGEAVVSGAVNPDHFVLDSRTGTLVEQRLGSKEIVIRSLPGGGTERVTFDSRAEQACLTKDQLGELARLGARVQSHYGAPQDTEWALDVEGRCWLTQSRPITTLYPLISRPDQSGLRAFMCLSLAQGLTRPITPMGLAAVRLIGASVLAAAGRPVADVLAGPTAMRTDGQRVFVDATAALGNPLGRRIMITIFGVMEARASTVMRALSERPEFARRRSRSWRLLESVSRVARKTGLPRRVVGGLRNPNAAYTGIDRTESQLRSRLDLPTTATPAERLDHVQRMLSTEIFLVMPATIGYAIGGFLMLGLANRLLRGISGPGELSTVLRGLPHNVTTEMDIALWDVAEQIRADSSSRARFEDDELPDLAQAYAAGTLPEVGQLAVRQFLDSYGHRAVAEIDIGMPRWSDDPSHLLGALKNYLFLHDPTQAPPAQFAAGAAEGEAMAVDLSRRAGERSRLRGRLVRFALARARALAGLRESPKFLLVVALAGLRAHLQTVGAALVDGGALTSADDIFFLDLAEARRGLAGEQLHDLVTARRQAYDLELRRRHIPRVLLSDGTEPETMLRPLATPPGSLLGSPASAGLVTAPARVILDPVGARLEPGEILVAPSTDPGWTPLFLTAGGLVMEMGGSNSHGAVVAREYGIPAVVGVPNATQQIITGQVITVDGGAGLVSLVDQSSGA